MASRADNLASNFSLAKFSQATELKNRIWFTIGALIVFRFLSFVPLPGVDPVLLAGALAFILALGFAGVAVVRVDRARQLWPPMRGPPAFS